MRTFLGISLILIMISVLAINLVGVGRDLDRAEKMTPRFLAIAINLYLLAAITYLYVKSE